MEVFQLYKVQVAGNRDFVPEQGMNVRDETMKTQSPR